MLKLDNMLFVTNPLGKNFMSTSFNAEDVETINHYKDVYITWTGKDLCVTETMRHDGMGFPEDVYEPKEKQYKNGNNTTFLYRVTDAFHQHTQNNTIYIFGIDVTSLSINGVPIL